MIFRPTSLSGVVRVEAEPRADDRGAFSRVFCAREFEAQGLPTVFRQCNVSWNRRAGTLRGMHWQAEPYGEGKLVRCERGAIYDVVVDLRPESPSYLRWEGFELRGDGGALWIPAGFAHGFLTEADDTAVHYQMTTDYVAEAARGLRWNDPRFGIRWPSPIAVISDRDQSFPDYVPEASPPGVRVAASTGDRG